MPWEGGGVVTIWVLQSVDRSAARACTTTVRGLTDCGEAMFFSDLRLRCLAAWLCRLGLCLLVSCHAAAAPERVVSLNLCTDELLLQLGDHKQIAGLSWLARDANLTWHSAEAMLFPAVRGVAEEIIRLEPDLVLAGEFTTPATVALLERLEIPLLRLPLARSFSEIADQIHQVADALGQGARGREMLADMRLRLDALGDGGGTITAALFQPNGQTATTGSLLHEVMTRAGLHNLAADWPQFAPLPLETLVYREPQLLVLSRHGAHVSLATELLEHPVLRGRLDRIEIPAQAWTCGTINTVRAVEILHGAAREGRPET